MPLFESVDSVSVAELVLVSGWSFNEGAGLITNDGISSNNGNLQDSPIWNKSSQQLGAYALDFPRGVFTTLLALVSVPLSLVILKIPIVFVCH